MKNNKTFRHLQATAKSINTGSVQPSGKREVSHCRVQYPAMDGMLSGIHLPGKIKRNLNNNPASGLCMQAGFHNPHKLK